MIPAGAIRPVFDCPGFLSMVFYLATGTASGVFRAVNRSAFYHFSAASDGPDLTIKAVNEGRDIKHGVNGDLRQKGKIATLGGFIDP